MTRLALFLLSAIVLASVIGGSSMLETSYTIQDV